MSEPQQGSVEELVAACLMRLRMVAETPAMYPTFFREELGLEGGVSEISAEAAADLAVGALHSFLEDELFDGDPKLSSEQIVSVFGELQYQYNLQDVGLTADDIDRDSESWSFEHVFDLLNEVARQIFTLDAAGWFERDGREKLLVALRHYSNNGR